jgi:hypothetical protein
MAAAYGNERFLPKETLLEMGYRPYRAQSAPPESFSALNELPTDLPWPVRFQDEGHTIAQSFVQFQDYGSGAYFHGGCDLRTLANAPVVAPVNGVLEGGYYSYSSNPDGSTTKYWKAWKESELHDDLYFELALTTDDGYRFELHHVDPMHLPPSTVAALNHGNIKIKKGIRIATVHPWDSDYHHVHYNVIAPDGHIINPEAHSVLVTDTLAPEILGVFGLNLQSQYLHLTGDQSIAIPLLKEIVVVTRERKNFSRYYQTPPYVALTFDSGESVAWDFRQMLWIENAFPDIRQVFLPSLDSDDGLHYQNFGNYGAGQFLMRLKMPNARGPFHIDVSDIAGNSVSFRATYAPSKTQ